MKRTNIYLKARQTKELRALSAETGASVAELVRRAVDRYLTERRKAEKGEGENGKEH
jgi:metal-responsive CopG/Arc/MetJ family transcriptional regulator